MGRSEPVRFDDVRACELLAKFIAIMIAVLGHPEFQVQARYKKANQLFDLLWCLDRVDARDRSDEVFDAEAHGVDGQNVLFVFGSTWGSGIDSSVFKRFKDRGMCAGSVHCGSSV